MKRQLFSALSGLGKRFRLSRNQLLFLSIAFTLWAVLPLPPGFLSHRRAHAIRSLGGEVELATQIPPAWYARVALRFPRSLSSLIEYVFLDRIAHVRLSGQKHTSEHLSLLHGEDCLESLDVSDSQISSSALIAFLLAEGRTVSYLDISGTCADASVAPALARMHNLRVLDIGHTQLAGRDLWFLEQVSPQFLALDGMRLLPEEMHYIVGCPIEGLSLRGTNVTDRHFTSLPHSQLAAACAEIDLSKTGVGIGSALALCAVPELRTISLERTQVSAEGIRQLLVVHASHLYRLDLSGTLVNDAALNEITRASGISVLKLADTSVSDRKCASLFSEGFPVLRELDLSGTRVGDETAYSLSHLVRQSLWRINFADTEVTDDGMAALADAIREAHVSNGIFELSLRKTSITDKSVARLRRCMPLRIDVGETRITVAGRDALTEDGHILIRNE